jgi:immunity protein, SdpI family
MRKWIPLLLIVAAVAASIFYYPQLPERMATHWSATGEANGFSSRLWGAWLMPLIMALIWVILRAIPHIDPRGANYEKFSGMYDALVILILAFMLLMHVVVLMAATGTRVQMERVMMPAVGVFIGVMGFLIPKAHPNWFVGIRTPWTLTSDLSWERTHKIGGTLFVILGALMVASTFIAPEIAIWILVAAALGITIFLFAYSYQVWKTDPLKR